MQENFKEVFRYLHAAYRYRVLAVILGLLVMTAVGAYSLALPKTYQADTTVFIEKSVIDNLVKGIAVTPNINDRIRVLRYAILSRDLIVKTLEKIDSEIFTKPQAEQQAYVAGLQERTNIRIRGNDLFIVTLEGQNPAFIQKFVNTLVNLYVGENTSAKREEAYGANRFIDEQIETFKQQLDEAEDAITQFRKEQGIFFTVDEQAHLEEIKEYMGEVENLELKIDTLQSKKQQLQDQLANLSPTVESVFSVGSGPAGVHPRVAAMEQRLAELRLRYTENYPEIQRLRFELEELKKRLAEQREQALPGEQEAQSGGSKMTSLNPLYLDVQQRLLEVQGDLSEARSQKQNSERLIAKRKSELNEIPEARKQLNMLVQKRNSLERLYQELLARKGTSEVSKQMEISNKAATFRVVDPAMFPEVPVAPNLPKWLLLAIAAGLGTAAAIIFLLENLDGRLRSPSALEEMGVDVLAVISNIAEPGELAQRRRANIYLVVLSGLYGSGFVGVYSYFIYLQ